MYKYCISQTCLSQLNDTCILECAHGLIVVTTDVGHTQHSRREASSRMLYPSQLYSGGTCRWLPTHLWLLLLDELQHLMSEPVILGPCVGENIDERARERNFQGNFYSSDAHFWTIATTLLRGREGKNAIISEAEKKGICWLCQVALGALERKPFSSLCFSVRLPLD